MNSVYKQIKNKILKYKPDEIISSSELVTNINNKALVYQALSRLTNENILLRIAYGKYCIPKKTRFGIVGVSDNTILKYVINTFYKKTANKPYFISNTIFNKLGLTTQLSSEVFLIAKVNTPYNFKVNNLKINILVHKGEWKTKDIKYHEFLYCLENIKKIPDTNPSQVYEKLKKIFNKFKIADVKRLIILVKEYKKITQVLFGTILDGSGYTVATKQIYNSLNSTTIYRIAIDDDLINIKLKRKWKIYEPTRKKR